MAAKLFLFEKFNWGRWSFETETTEEQKKILKSIVKNAKHDEQLLVHRRMSEDILHYVYALRLSDGTLFCIYLGSKGVIIDIDFLFWLFQSIVQQLVLKTFVIKEKPKKHALCSTKMNYQKRRYDIDIFWRSLEGLVEQGLEDGKLLPCENGRLDSEHPYLERNLEDCTTEEIIQQIEYGYYNFVITQNRNGKLASSFKIILHQKTMALKGEIAEQEVEPKRQKKASNEKKNQKSNWDKFWELLGGVFFIVFFLINIIVPWFVHSGWPKIAIVSTCLACFLIFGIYKYYNRISEKYVDLLFLFIFVLVYLPAFAIIGKYVLKIDVNHIIELITNIFPNS